MKTFLRILITAIVIMALPGTAQSQLRYGIRLGGVFAKPSPGNAGDLSVADGSGFSGGLALEYQAPKSGLAADIAVLYTRFNTRFESTLAEKTDPGRNFIEVPIHVKYKFWLPAFHNLFGPMVYTGPSLMTRVGSHSSATFFPHPEDAPSSSTPAAISTVSTKTFQPGWDVGIGIDIVNFLQINAGYRFGLGNAFDSASGATMRTNAWTVSATLLFDF